MSDTLVDLFSREVDQIIQESGDAQMTIEYFDPGESIPVEIDEGILAMLSLQRSQSVQGADEENRLRPNSLLAIGGFQGTTATYERSSSIGDALRRRSPADEERQHSSFAGKGTARVYRRTHLTDNGKWALHDFFVAAIAGCLLTATFVFLLDARDVVVVIALPFGVMAVGALVPVLRELAQNIWPGLHWVK